MGLLIYIILAWFVITYFLVILPKEEAIVNIILYMIQLILTVSVSSIISLDLELIKITDSKLQYIAVVIFKNIMIPMTLVIFSSIYKKIISIHKRILAITLLLLFDSAMELFNLHLHLITYVKWRFEYYLMFICAYFFIVLNLRKLLETIQARSEFQDDHLL